MTALGSTSAQVLSAFTEEDIAFLKSLALEPVGPTEGDGGFLAPSVTDAAATSKAGLDADPSHPAKESKLEEALQTAALL